MTITQLQQEFLAPNKERIASEDFFILLAHATKKEKSFLLTHSEYSLVAMDEIVVREYFTRRFHHEPVALIVGQKEFYGYDFRVTRDTLIPRPETEQIVELALNRIRNQVLRIRNEETNIQILDVGTGSGNIIIAIASELKKSHPRFTIHNSPFTLHATDISKKALAVAKENAKTHNVDPAIAFLHGDLLAPYAEKHFQPNARLIIVANLPYLSSEIYVNAPKDVRNFEPESALVSDQAGLAHYHRLLKEIKNAYTKPLLITLFLEISPEQAQILQSFALSLFPHAEIKIHKDLAQKDRVIEIRMR